MRLIQLRRPLLAASASTWKPGVASTTPCLAELFSHLRLDGGAAVDGRRYASVKSQGHYKLKWKRTIPKKMGAKRTGDQYVIPGNMIYKQRGTIWHAGENTILSRNHTIHAAVSGYVKYYRDPLRHPTRQYIGVTFNREDKLPYPPNAARRRRLGLVPNARKPEPEAPEALSPSGIPMWVVRRQDGLPAAKLEVAEAEDGEGAGEVQQQKPAAVAAKVKKSKRTLAKQQARQNAALRLQQRRVQRETRVLHLQSDYSYREYNWEIGRLIGPAGRVGGTGKLGSRKSRLRARRKRRNAHFKEVKAIAAANAAARAEHREQVAKEKALRAAEAAQVAQADKDALKARAEAEKKA